MRITYTPITGSRECSGALVGAKVFSKLDANSGFYQIPLDPCRQAKLTTFITLFSRYNYNWLPFGNTSALNGVTGTVSMIDDALVLAKNQEEHDKHLVVALEKI